MSIEIISLIGFLFLLFVLLIVGGFLLVVSAMGSQLNDERARSAGSERALNELKLGLKRLERNAVEHDRRAYLRKQALEAIKADVLAMSKEFVREQLEVSNEQDSDTTKL